MGQVELTEGERWTREQLRELRRARFTPAAAGRFLAAAQRRAGERRASRPALARQARAWIGTGGLAWVILAIDGRRPFRRRLGSGLASWGLTGLMLDWHLGMVETVDGRPRTLGAADACTLVRAWLVPVAADAPSSIVCALALATDGLDGALARAGEPTRLGRDLEGVVDAAFAAAALRGAVRQGWLAPSAATAEGARLVAGGAYAIAAYLGSATPPDPVIRRAARLATPVRGAGLVAAGLGRRRTAGALVWTGAVVSAAAVGGVAGLKIRRYSATR
jgi:phosphatidylglycerophosphate synthase